MKIKIIISVLLIGIAFAGAISWESDLIFSHKFHTQEAQANCDACHSNAPTSEKGADDLLPTMQTCYSCHDENSECTVCHKQPDAPLILPRISEYVPQFSHKLHREQGIDCVGCHTGIDSKEAVSGVMHLPNMDACMKCHQTPEEIDGCYSCHNKSQELKPQDHTELWRESHGVYAEAGGVNCKLCHSENYCVECHQGENLGNNSHPAEFIAAHSLSYLAHESDCANCHDAKDFCITCHREVNHVIPATHLSADWSGRGHSQAARTEFDNCTVCHSEGDALCSQCHN